MRLVYGCRGFWGYLKNYRPGHNWGGKFGHSWGAGKPTMRSMIMKF